MIEKIEWNDTLLALVIRAKYEPTYVEFFTSKDNPLQLGIMKHKQGYQIKPHFHNNIIKTINDTQEVLHVEYGRTEVSFYDAEGNKIKGTTLHPHDTILLISGGHGFTMLEDTKMIEVKQGPYGGVDEDKKYISQEPGTRT